MHGIRSSQNVMDISCKLCAHNPPPFCIPRQWLGRQFVLCKLILFTVLWCVAWSHILSKNEFEPCGLVVWAWWISIFSSRLFCFINLRISAQFREVTRACVTDTVFFVYRTIVLVRSSCRCTSSITSAIDIACVFGNRSGKKQDRLSTSCVAIYFLSELNYYFYWKNPRYINIEKHTTHEELAVLYINIMMCLSTSRW